MDYNHFLSNHEVSGAARMKRRWATLAAILFVLCVMVFLQFQAAQASADPQIPTGTIPTVTGTPSGLYVTVRLDLSLPSVNLREGPNTSGYKTVGVLLVGQKAQAIGRSPGGDWIEIVYPGAPGGVAWVYAPYVNVSPGDLKIVQSPPTATPLYTATIDPTLASQFVVTLAPTRLATFTPPSPLSIPTFVAAGSSNERYGIPMGLVIIILGGIGLLLLIFSFTQGR
jgi:hypothetical protein